MAEAWEEVFETPDVDADADDQHALRDANEATSSDVVVEEVPRPEQVFEVFAGKRFVAGGARERPEVVSAGETVFERFNRLRSEVDLLARELELGSEQAEDAPAHSEAYAQLARGVLSLQDTLQQLRAGKGTAALLANQGSESATPLALDAATQAHAEELRERLKVAQSAPQGTGSVTYELFYTRAGDSAPRAGAGDELALRVARLEGILGLDPAAPGPATSRPLTDAVAELERKLGLLDEGRLSILAQKAKTLSTNVDELAKLRQRRSSSTVASSGASASAALSSEVDLQAVVDKIDRCDGVAATIPALIERLRVVQEIHQHNANVHARLDGVDVTLADVAEAARLDRELLMNLKEGIAANMETMQANLAKLRSS